MTKLIKTIVSKEISKKMSSISSKMVTLKIDLTKQYLSKEESKLTWKEQEELLKGLSLCFEERIKVTDTICNIHILNNKYNDLLSALITIKEL